MTNTTEKIGNHDVLNALYMLRNALKCRDTEDAHNILINGSYDLESEEENYEIMEKELDDYFGKLHEIITFVKNNNYEKE
jgi:transcription termination factor Rho